MRAAPPVWRRALSSLAAFAVASLVIVAADGGVAVAAPDLTVTAGAPGKVLFGGRASHSIEACNSTATSGYNLSFRAVIGDNGVHVVGSGTAPSQSLPNSPVSGSTTLIWENVSDIPVGACVSIDFDVDHVTTSATFDVGDSYVVDVGAYTNSDPRWVPDFDASGVPIAGIESYTGSGTSSSSTEISAIEVTKTEPSTESELLRGVHDHQTTYTVTIQNNYVNQTDGVVLEDQLPAGLEFLGCGGDNTTDAPTNPDGPFAPPDPEYPGSGSIAGSLAPCVAPDVVDTVDDRVPLGAVFTVVEWNNAGAGYTMLAGDTLVFEYRAAIPIRENTMTWTGGSEPATTGVQTANLDNNGGPETSEANAAEQGLTNTATADGLYTRNDLTTVAVADTDSFTVSAEDLSVHKAVLDGTIAQGDIETWVLTIETSEYRTVDDIVVHDVLPDGLCPLGLVNHDASDPTGECAPTGDVPTIQLTPFGGPPGAARNIDYTAVSENADGTWDLTFDPTVDTTLVELASMAQSATVTITIPTRTREFYQENGADDTAVVANDAWSNSVDVEGTSLVPAIDTDQVAPIQIQDVSASGQSAGLPQIDKSVADPAVFVPGALPTPCPVPGTLVPPTPSPYVDGPVASYGPGDVACWALRVDFPANLDTAGAVVTDFIPPGHTFVVGSDQIAAGSVPATLSQSGSALTWTLGSGGDVDIAQVFLIVFATQVDDPQAATSVDVSGNLMKFQSNNTAGDVSPLRDQADAEWAEAELTLLKGVKTINGLPLTPNGPNVDGGTVIGNDAVVYRIDLTNGGDRDATSVEVWDELPDEIACLSDVSAISAGGACHPTENRIVWTGLAVGAATSSEVNYTVTIPAGTSPNQSLDNTAGVRTYQSSTNTGSTFAYYPASNIDPLVTSNTDAASDSSDVVTAQLTATKTAVTPVVEAGNSAAQATIGERIDYTVTIPIPALLTVKSPQFVDALGANQTLDTSSVAATLDDPAPGGTDITTSPDWTVDTSGNTVTITYVSGDLTTDADGTTMTVTFSATVDDEPANVRGGSITNTATFSWTDQNLAPDSVTSNQSSVPIVEPNLTVDKTELASTTTVSGGTVLSYRVRVTNPTTPGSVSPAHDVTVVDTLPADFTTPSSISSGGMWNSTARTITWTGIDVDPGATVDLTYTLTIDSDVPAGATLTNTAAATATSLAGAVAGERTDAAGVAGYSASDGYTVTAVDPAIAKSVAPTNATIGEQVQYSITVTIPADAVMWDVRVTDLVPDGVVFDGTSSVTCPGCSPSVAATTLTPTVNGDGTTTLGFWLGDIATSTADRVLTIVYDAHVADVYSTTASVLATETLVNSALLGWNHTDTVAVDPVLASDLTATVATSGPATSTLTVVEPALGIVKKVNAVDAADVQPGDSLTYDLTITNTGGAAAYDVTVTDVPDVELTNIVVTTGAGDVVDGWSAVDPDIVFVHPGPIAPAGSVTYSYTADLVASGSIATGASAANTATLTEYHGRPSAERGANPTIDYRTYGGANDAVTAAIHFPTGSLTKTAVGPDPAAVGTPYEWSIQVTNTSTHADMASVTVDDTLPANWDYDTGSTTVDGVSAANPTVVTNPAGDQLTWSLPALAAGASTTIAFTASPTAAAQVDPGVVVVHTNTADAIFTDNTGASGNATAAYGTNQDTADATLSVGSIGDVVWFDADDNGVFDGVDIPLAGVRVDLVWAGPDGSLATTGDNVAYTTTTAADGTYSFTTLPEGAFSATIDATTLPAGTAPSYDLDGGTTTPDGIWVGSLASAQNRTDVDFGYTGTGSLGDLVWYDTNADGSAAGDIGLPAVTVDVIWSGPDNDLATAADNVPYSAATDSNGAYLVPNLPAGAYSATVDAATLPTGLASTYDLDGGLATPDGAWIGSLGDAENKSTVDFGYDGVGSISDLVWYDVDKDGVQDVGEIGLPGVTVDLVWAGPDGDLSTAGDNVALSTTTAADGTYSFANLADGSYSVTVDETSLPAGFTASSDLDGGTDSTALFALNTTSGRDRADVDFAYIGTGTIGNRVQFDANADGAHDVGEIGLGGVVVDVVWAGPDGDLATTADNVTYTTTTASAGGYTVTELPAGVYEVTVDGTTIPAGFVESYDPDGIATAGSWTGSLAAGENNADIDFGYKGTGSLGDTIWFDRDADGVVDGDEVGLASVGVDLTWAGQDGNLATAVDNVTFAATTDAAGSYGFPNLPAGTYRVDVDVTTLPTGMSPTFDLDGTASASTWSGALGAAADKLDVDFGYNGTGSLGDTVWFDRNGDFVVDPGEPGLEAVAVTVTWHGPDGVVGGGDDAVFVTATGGLGDWSVTGLPPGNYSVVVDGSTLPTGMAPTGDLDGVGTPSAWKGALTDGSTRTDIDFGYAGSGSIGDYVWIDTNADGTQDAGESGVVGAAVELVWPGEDGLLGTGDEETFTTTTDALGTYDFGGLPPGDYRVTVVGSLPASAPNTFDEDGGGDSTTLVALADGVAHATADFGYGGSASIGDRVWWDLDGDGVQDAGEPGLVGIEVTLVGTNPDTSTFTVVTQTAADGAYLFDGLTAADYVVSVTNGLPGGTVQTHDDTLPLDNSSAVPGLAAGTAYLLADFGYTGTASIGDRVWLDLDGDAAADGDEPGMVGVDMVLTWAGPDGLTGTGDDVELRTTTGPDGGYLFANLPAGDYTVVLDASTVPTGLVVTADGEGAVDGSAAYSLVGGEVIDSDVGLTGPGVLGDVVWFDLDGDGAQTVDEPGLEGVTVALTLPGADGLIGGGDDVTTSTLTGPDGGYSFGGLYDGAYVVTVDPPSLPADMAPSYDLDSATVGADGVWQGLLDTIAGPQLAVDFGYRGTAGVGDLVWLDLDGDGVRGTDEPGVSGLAVELTWPGEDGLAGTGDDTMIPTTTDAAGAYSFPGLPAGDYTITLPVLPAGLFPTHDEDLTADGSTTLTLATGASHDTADFGVQGTASIGDVVWFDVDGDGLEDPGEPGLAGVAVTVMWLGADGLAGTGDDVVFPAVTTGAAGAYGVSGVPEGLYVVSVTGGLPGGFLATADEDGTPDAVANIGPIVAAEVHDTTDFGFTGTGSIDAQLWLDLDGDGAVGAGEPGLPLVPITAVWAGVDGLSGTGDDVTFATTTGPEGTYTISNLPAGDYTVTVDATALPGGLTGTHDPDGGFDHVAIVTLVAGVSSGEPSFGHLGPGSVGDTVWHDVDGDGTQNGGEPGVATAIVAIGHHGADGAPGGGDDLVVEVVTDGAGNYVVAGLPLGTFDAVLSTTSLSTGLVPGTDGDGGDPASTAGTILDGSALLEFDFGVVGTSSIAGALLFDPDGDGTGDPGAGGLGGVMVEVTWEGPDGPVTVTAVTASGGSWLIEQLPPGDYVVTYDETTLPGHHALTSPVANAVMLGPDAAISLGAGVVEMASIDGTLWIDSDGDGVQDPDELPVAGVVITVYDETGQVVAVVVTDADGRYVIPDLMPGSYTVSLDPTTFPAGFDVLGDTEFAVTVDGNTGVAAMPTAFVGQAGLPATGFFSLDWSLVGIMLIGFGLIVLGLAPRRRSHV